MQLRGAPWLHREASGQPPFWSCWSPPGSAGPGSVASLGDMFSSPLVPETRFLPSCALDPVLIVPPLTPFCAVRCLLCPIYSIFDLLQYVCWQHTSFVSSICFVFIHLVSGIEEPKYDTILQKTRTPSRLQLGWLRTRAKSFAFSVVSASVGSTRSH